MVDHLTRVTVERACPRAAELGHALLALGFTVREEPRRLRAESTAVEGGRVKASLRAAGFADRDYQVVVEFVRKWGVL